MAEKMAWHTDEVRATAQLIAARLTQAAEPGPVPVATGSSPIDAAAAAVAAEIAAQVGKSSANLAARAADGLAKAQATMTGAESADGQQARRIEAVGGGSAEQLTAGGQWEPWDDDDDDIVRHPVPIIPPVAGPGPGAVGGAVPSSLV